MAKRRGHTARWLLPKLVDSTRIHLYEGSAPHSYSKSVFPFSNIADWAFLGQLGFGICLRRIHGRRYAAVLRRTPKTFKLSPHCCHRSRRITSWTAAEFTTSAPDILVLSCFRQIHRLFCSFSPILIVPVCRPHARELGAISHSLAAV